MKCPSSSREAGKKGQIPPSSTFCSLQALNGLDDAHPHWESHTLLSLCPKMFSQAYPETVFWPGLPLAHSGPHIKLLSHSHLLALTNLWFLSLVILKGHGGTSLLLLTGLLGDREALLYTSVTLSLRPICEQGLLFS